MKNILTISGALALMMFALTSCHKTYDCVCDLKTYAIDTQDTLKTETTHHTIKGTKYDAEDACKYYETEEDYLQRPAIVYHYCGIVEDYGK
ncbi:MAG: hypothetical protein KDC07_10645 [Chitinophagaceae bacterium]|nr:hypothetical protein [Chitinophagaceae bacterium]MCB9046605.1 hypothetical protein [Chitinophagales bacterium]